jgi:AcrR family transcriptional regulator
MATTSTEPRIPLSRERILRAALAIADEHGVEALSMRKLGQALGFEAMSLYNHVQNKDDVLDGMLDLVLAETERPDGADAWDAAVRRSAISVHAALRRHPWAARLLTSSKHIRPARIAYMDALLGSLTTAGFSDETIFHAYHAIDGHTIGFTLWEISHNFPALETVDIEATLERFIPADTYPHLREHGRQHFAEGPHRDVSAFEYGLDLILEGLRKIRAATES